MGSFAQTDSLVPSGAQGLDRYAYVNNNPVRYNDPSGHCVWDACIIESTLITDVVVVTSLVTVVIITSTLIKGGRSTNAPIIDVPSIRIPSPDGPKPGPILENCDGPSARVICYLIGPAVVATLLIKSISIGGCGEDESNCKHPSSVELLQEDDTLPSETSNSASSNHPRLQTTPVEIHHKPDEIVIHLQSHQPTLDIDHHRYGAQD